MMWNDILKIRRYRVIVLLVVLYSTPLCCRSDSACPVTENDLFSRKPQLLLETVGFHQEGRVVQAFYDYSE